MAGLYCEEHGKAHEARVMGLSAIYREEGESVLIVTSTLKSGHWLCDGCNVRLGRGDTAMLLVSFDRWHSESMHDYDFVYERQYFAMRGAEKVAVYGAAWPCGDLADLMRREAIG